MTHSDSLPQAESYKQAIIGFYHCAIANNFAKTLTKFWELEKVPQLTERFIPPGNECEKLFRETHIRDNKQRYVIHLPLKSKLPEFGLEIRKIAVASLTHIHRQI
ncbi:hypothetical protein M0802_016072 [Mischocyttarus mexicanus]|nr:hypothetical protein M0802_016072 [Mischocyttarus mexicanus]